MENKQINNEYIDCSMSKILIEFIYGMIHEVNVFNEILEPNELYSINTEDLLDDTIESLVKFDGSYEDRRKYIIYRLISKIDFCHLDVWNNTLFELCMNEEFETESLDDDLAKQIVTESLRYELKQMKEELRLKGE